MTEPFFFLVNVAIDDFFRSIPGLIHVSDSTENPHFFISIKKNNKIIDARIKLLRVKGTECGSKSILIFMTSRRECDEEFL